MGLFDKLSGKKETELSAKGGLLLAAITMIAVDGDIDEDEISIVQRLDRKNDGAWDEAVRAWKMNSFEDCIPLAAGAMNGEQSMVAIANLIDIAMADGLLVGKEKELLEVYLELFDLNESDVAKVVDVISIKNNDSIF